LKNKNSKNLITRNKNLRFKESKLYLMQRKRELK